MYTHLRARTRSPRVLTRAKDGNHTAILRSLGVAKLDDDRKELVVADNVNQRAAAL